MLNFIKQEIYVGDIVLYLNDVVITHEEFEDEVVQKCKFIGIVKEIKDDKAWIYQISKPDIYPWNTEHDKKHFLRDYIIEGFYHSYNVVSVYGYDIVHIIHTQEEIEYFAKKLKSGSMTEEEFLRVEY